MDITLLGRRARSVPINDVLRLIEAKDAERDRAYGDGYDAGFLDGVEAGLKQSLEHARLALGEAA